MLLLGMLPLSLVTGLQCACAAALFGKIPRDSLPDPVALLCMQAKFAACLLDTLFQGMQVCS